MSTRAEHGPASVSPPAARRVGSGPGASAAGGVGLALARWRLVLAFVIAAASDVSGLVFEGVPPASWVVDVVTAVLLIAVLGFDWRLAPALVAEAIPGVGVLPFWVLVVLWVAKSRAGGASYDRPGP